ncbi:M23 family metallopeptidase [Wenyingzhuangia sp. 2_MG-2023]|nr:M23 family metallopeptidase [Wenyingzhuangia sp. 2_MG-2023]MDO6738972.1 M23 family metallopeptidase [Wenyingzhuangia sp. 2_MG-2023]
MKKSIIFLLFINICSSFAQKNYPQNQFRNPLDIPIVLAGTFGELRTNHFHSGIDIKTNGVSGKKVYAAHQGYVSRIKISLWGYGKAIYVTHPNGYTTVYAHLKKFSDKIENYIKAKQYQKKSFEIQLFPGKGELPIETDEIIAYSGNTGGSTAPHLHFEIRDTKTEKIINPLLFGYDVKDNIHPTVLGLRISPLGKKSAINNLPVAQEIPLTKINAKTYVSKTIKATGKIGISIRTHDLLNYAPNKNGVYSIETYVNDTLKYHHDLETFSFDESKYINLLIDYAYYATKSRKFQKTYVEPFNKLSIYKNTVKKGYLNISDQKQYTVLIKISDFAKNVTTVKIPIQRDSIITPVLKEATKTPYYIPTNQYCVFKNKNVELRFPKATFYENMYLDFNVEDDHIHVHKPTLPLSKNYTIAYFMDSISPKQQKHAYLALKYRNNYNYVSSDKKGNKLYANTKSLGDFTVKYDSIAPKIEHLSFYKNQNLANHKSISVVIKDLQTDIKSYYATIDNEWILMEYEPKKNLLTFDLNDLKTQNKKHIFQLKIEDLLGNTNSLTIDFTK